MISAAQYLPYYSLTIPQPVGHRYIQTTALFKTKFLSKVTWRKVDKRETKKLKKIFENKIINFNFFSPILSGRYFWKNSSIFCSAFVLWKNPPSNDGSTQGLNNYGGYLPTCQHTGQFIYLKTKRSWVWVTSMLIEEKSYVIKNKPHYSGLGWYTKPF